MKRMTKRALEARVKELEQQVAGASTHQARERTMGINLHAEIEAHAATKAKLESTEAALKNAQDEILEITTGATA